MNASVSSVLLYAPRDEAQHGYFGIASVIDLNWDALDPRFLIRTLDQVELFATPLSIAAAHGLPTEFEDWWEIGLTSMPVAYGSFRRMFMNK